AAEQHAARREGQEGEGEGSTQQAAPQPGGAGDEQSHSPGDDREGGREEGAPPQRGDEDRVVCGGAHGLFSFVCRRSRASRAALSLGSSTVADAASSGSKRATSAAAAAAASVLWATDSMALRRLSGARVRIVHTTRPRTVASAAHQVSTKRNSSIPTAAEAVHA